MPEGRDRNGEPPPRPSGRGSKRSSDLEECARVPSRDEEAPVQGAQGSTGCPSIPAPRAVQAVSVQRTKAHSPVQGLLVPWGG